MATRSFTVATLGTFGDNVRIITWTGLLNGDDGTPFEMPGWADRSIQFTGTFGAGGTILLEGSNLSDFATFFPLVDPQGNAISKTSAAGEQVLEIVRWVRPRVSAGDGTTTLVATLLVGGKK